MRENGDFYQIMFNSFVEQSNPIKKITDEQFFRLTKFPDTLPIKIKMKILEK